MELEKFSFLMFFLWIADIFVYVFHLHSEPKTHKKLSLNFFTIHSAFVRVKWFMSEAAIWSMKIERNTEGKKTIKGKLKVLSCFSFKMNRKAKFSSPLG